MNPERIPYLDDLDTALTAAWRRAHTVRSPVHSLSRAAVTAAGAFALVLVLVGLPWLALDGGSPGEPGPGRTSTDPELLLGVWSPIEGEVDGRTLIFADALELGLDGEWITGTTGCAGFGTTYRADRAGTWSIESEFGVQAVSCGPIADDFQDRYIDAVTRTVGFEVSPTQLVISGPGVVLTFERISSTPRPRAVSPTTLAPPGDDRKG